MLTIPRGGAVEFLDWADLSRWDGSSVAGVPVYPVAPRGVLGLPREAPGGVIVALQAVQHMMAAGQRVNYPIYSPGPVLYEGGRRVRALPHERPLGVTALIHWPSLGAP